MAPTLLPAHLLATCLTCDLRYPVAVDTQPGAKCFHCGNPLDDFVDRPADNVTVVPLNSPRSKNVETIEQPSKLQRGDIVLIEGNAIHPDDRTPVLKRIFATSGQTVDLEGDALVVRSSNQVPEMPSIWIPVDNDASRIISRWRPIGDPSRESVLYHHVSVHDHGLPSPIYDDIPFNTSIHRILKRPRQIRFRGIYGGKKPGSAVITAWVDGQVFRWQRLLAPEEAFTGTLGGSADLNVQTLGVSDVSISAENSVHLVGPIRDRVIEQAIVYRIRPTDPRDVYPVQLNPNEVFVVGDNVPVSRDSRLFGPLPESAVVGVVVTPGSS